MPAFQRFIQRYLHVLRHTTWWIIVAMVVGSFLVGLVGMWLFEFNNSEANIKGVWDYVYWWCVTAPTVGYGDRAPVTIPGQAIGIIVILTSVATLGLAIPKAIDSLMERRRRHMKGEGTLDESITNHTVILGHYAPGLTEELVTELLAGEPDETIALVVDADDPVTENPIPQSIGFFRGGLTTDVWDRSGLWRAGRIIAYGRDDFHTFALVAAARFHNPTAPIVAVAKQLTVLRVLVDMFNEQDASEEDVTCVLAGASSQIVNELRSPGIQALLDSAISDADGDGIGQHHLTVPTIPTHLTYEELNRYLDTCFGIRIIGTKQGNGKPDPLPKLIRSSDVVYYVGGEIDPEQIKWDAVMTT